MEYLFIYLVIFIIIFLLYKLYFFLREKYNVKKKILEVFYLETKHKFKIDKKDIKKIYNYISIINSFILTVSYAVYNIQTNLILQIITTIITIFVLIFCLYEILGNYYKKR